MERDAGKSDSIMVYMIESEEMINGKKFQTKIIRHKGYRRIVKFRHSNKQQVSDDTKIFKNHPDDCDCGAVYTPQAKKIEKNKRVAKTKK